MQKEILNDKRVPEHERFYKKYFQIKETPIRGTQVSVKEDAVKKTKRYYGYFALLSNKKMDAMTVLELYRNKDLIEKAFGKSKDCLNIRSLLVSSEKSLDGKFFVRVRSWRSSICLTSKNTYKKPAIFQNYTIQSLLDKLDIIECFEHPDYSLRVREVLTKQKQIYEVLGINPPS